MKVDMSPAAVTSRIRQVFQLRRLCLTLGNARPVDPSDHRAAEDEAKPKGYEVKTH
jgi:hypothetical protein